MKTLAILMPVLLIAGCGGVSGDYGGPDCLYQKISLKSDGTAYLTIFGTEISTQYKVDGDKISIVDQEEGAGLVFTKNGDDLETGLMGKKMVCKKL
jgi:hypothetical protein